MEIGPITRIGSVADSLDVSRAPASTAAAPSVPTDLPARKVVTQAAPVETATPAPSTSVERRVTIDETTRQVVSAVYEEQTGQLVSQVPDRALLRLQAYVREIVTQNEERKKAAQTIELTA